MTRNSGRAIPPRADLDPGETINCYFTNVAGASITVIKNVGRADLDTSRSASRRTSA